jgi:hypothetical protein
MADSFDKFSIGIDADVSALQSSLKAAQNTLAQFESALKKATNIGEINYLNKNIDNLRGTITRLNEQAGKLGKPMGDASQSLINFSRIAQDAPYGIMGVANNLNPMVESFQRLAKTEGGTKKALQAMVAGLAGPAGVGVAIGIVSSLAVTFSKEIKEFFKGPTGELEEFRKKLKEVADDIYKLIGGEQSKRTKGILLAEIIVGGNKTQQEEALKQLKSLYSSSAAIQNAKLGQDKAYYQTLVNQAAIQSSATAKEKNNIEQLNIANAAQIENEKKRNAELKKITSEKIEGTGFATRLVSVAEQKKAINDAYDILGDNIKKNIATLEFDTLQQLKTITLTLTADKVKKDGDKTIDALKEYSANLKYELSQQLMDIEKYKKIFKDKGFDNALILTYGDKGAAADRKTKMGEERKRVTGKDNSLGDFLTRDASGRMKGFKMESDRIDELNKSYESFAKQLSGNVVNALQGVYDAMQKGDSFGKAFLDMLGKITEQLVAMVIQTLIFRAIMAALTGGGSEVAVAASNVAGSAGRILMIPKYAEGGIVNKPHIGMVGEAGPEAIIPLNKLSGFLNTTFNAGAMSGGGAMAGGGSFVLKGNDLVLALQRSNHSLNLRRGI